MPVQSPIHSFVDFENRINTVLPAYKSQLSFQLLFSSDMEVPIDGTVQTYIGKADKTATVFPWTATVYDVCFWGKIVNIDADADFPIMVHSGQIIPANTYETFDELLAALQAVGFNAIAQTFLQCCVENLQNYTIAFTTGYSTSKALNINFFRGLIYIDGSANDQEADFNTNNIKINQCYTIAIGDPQNDDIHIVSQTAGATSEYTVVFDGTLRNGDEIDFSLTDGTGNLNFGEIASIGTTLDILLAAVEAELTLTGFPYTLVGHTLHIQPRSGTITGNTTVTVANPTISVAAYSNVFLRVASAKQLTFLTYYNNEDGYDFHYPADYLINRLWFPFYFSKPAYPVSRKIYRKSNKDYRVLSSTIEKQLTALTDYFKDEIHDRLIVALEHDHKHVFSDDVNYAVDQDIFMNSDYQINWPDRDYPDMPVEANATFKVLQVFAGRNSNCEKRPVCIALPVPDTGGGDGCVAVTITATTLEDATAGIAYSQDIPLNGTAPFWISAIVKPAWATVAVIGTNVHVSGTPPGPGTAETISFTASNACGNADFSQDINIAVNITFSNHNTCVSGDNFSSFKIHAPASTVLEIVLTMSGYFDWDNTVGSRNVLITASITSPAGLSAANISDLRNYTGQTGIEGVSDQSSTSVFVTVDGTGVVNINALANIENGGTGGLMNGYLKIISVNGVETNYSEQLCVGFSTGG
jgi:hypothetical protein